MNAINYSVAFDESGRGPLFGPVYVGAVAYPNDLELQKTLLEKLEGVNDSKKLTEKKRERLYKTITESLPISSFGVGSSTAKEIDKLGITKSIKMASQRALENINVKYVKFYFDGWMHLREEFPKILQHSEPKLDQSNIFCSAASILAKVSRDEFIKSLPEKYQKWNVAKHKGYGTKEHFELIEKFGVSDMHRISFLQKKLKTKSKGNLWEDFVVERLKRDGYKILARNFEKIGVGEVDIIAEKDETIFFFEVKYRSSTKFGSGEESVDKRKRERIQNISNFFLSKNPNRWKSVEFKIISITK